MKIVLLIATLSFSLATASGGETNKTGLLALALPKVGVQKNLSVKEVSPPATGAEDSTAMEKLNPPFFTEVKPRVPLLDDVDVLIEKDSNGRMGTDTYYYAWKKIPGRNITYGPGGKSFYPVTVSGAGRSDYALTFSIRFPTKK